MNNYFFKSIGLENIDIGILIVALVVIILFLIILNIVNIRSISKLKKKFMHCTANLNHLYKK